MLEEDEKMPEDLHDLAIAADCRGEPTVTLGDLNPHLAWADDGQ